MKCPKCEHEPLWDSGFEVYSRSSPCVACGYDMDGVEFYTEVESSYQTIDVREEK